MGPVRDSRVTDMSADSRGTGPGQVREKQCTLEMLKNNGKNLKITVYFL